MNSSLHGLGHLFRRYCVCCSSINFQDHVILVVLYGYRTVSGDQLLIVVYLVTLFSQSLDALDRYNNRID